MKYIIYTILIIIISFSVKAQVPTGVPTQKINGWIENWYTVPDSGAVITKRDTNFIPRFVGTTVTWQRPGIDTIQWFWNGLNWGRTSKIDTIPLHNQLLLKLNISDTANMLLPYLRKVDTTNKWVNNIRRRSGTDSVELFKNGSWQFAYRDSVGVGASGLTSVGLSMPSAFTVTNSPLISNGTISVSGAGTTLQYIRGNGTLATTDTGMIPNFYLKVRGLITNTSPITYNSTTGAIGINNATATGTKGAASFTSAFSDNGSGQIDLLTILTAGGCTKCNLTIDAKGRITNYNSSVVGLDTLNGLITTSQVFSIGTSGTDFNIVSAGNTHTFNLPSASASARGVINTTDQTIAGAKSFTRDISILGVSVGTGAGGSSTNSVVGSNSMLSNTGINNTAIGVQALRSNTSGGNNTAIGSQSLQSNTTGNNNVSIGASTLLNNTTGSFNVSIGSDVLDACTNCNFNIGIGRLAISQTTGGSNVAIGDQAGLSANGSGNVFLGASAGMNETSISNKLIISNTGSKNLIHGDFSNDSIKINGKLKVRDIDSITNPINVLLQIPSSGEIKKTSAVVIAALATIETALAASPNITTDHTTAIGSNRWQINGGDPSDYLFGVNNSTGGGIDVVSASSNAIMATTTSSTGIAVNGLALNGTGFNFTQSHSTSTNDVTVLGLFTKGNISQTPASGFGLANDYYLASAAGTSRQAGREAFKWTTATDASRTSMYELSTVNSGTLGRKFAISGSGQAILDSYTGSAFQTTDTSYNALVVDASGNVLKRAGDANLTASGLYTPTISAILNVDATTAHQCRYTRVGNIVFVGGVVEIDPTAASATSASITLPISSTFTVSDDINGVVSVNELTTPNAHITRTGNNALIAFTSGTTSNFALYFTFSYEVK